MSVCLFVFTAIDSAPESGTVLRPVSLEPAGLEGVQRKKNFPKSDRSGRITEEKSYATNAFQWKKFCYIFLPFILKGSTSSLFIFEGLIHKKAQKFSRLSYTSIFIDLEARNTKKNCSDFSKMLRTN
jgi:hypothetical protein